MSPAWGALLARGLVGLSRRVDIQPIAGADDGRHFFASMYSKAFSGVVEVDAGTSMYTPVHRFANPATDQAAGSFDGRWLVWDEYHSLQGLDDFAVWSWDSKTGRLRQIGAATRSTSGAFWSSDWVAPVALDGFAAWEQGTRSGGDLYVVNLATGRSRVLSRGHPGGPLLVQGGLVVWPESTSSSSATVMAAKVTTGQRRTPPPALRALRGAITPLSDGSSLVYASPSWTSVWWSPSMSDAPRDVFASPANNPLQDSLVIAHGHVAFVDWPAAYVADTRAGRYVEINDIGLVVLDNESLILVRPSAQKAAHAISDVIFLRLSSLPTFSACSR
jgi:hypothetical protein